MKLLRRIFSRLNVAELAALIVFAASSAAMVVKALWLNDVPAPVDWLHRLSSMGDSVLTSLIAGSSFFLVVNALFERSEFSRIRPWMQMKFRQAAGQYEGMIRDMANAADVEIPDDVFSIDLEAVLDRINPNESAPLIINRQGDHANWIGLMRYYANRARGYLQRIESRSTLLRSDSLEILDRAHDCSFFSQIDNVQTPIRNTNLEFLRSSLGNYCDVMREVRDHADLL